METAGHGFGLSSQPPWYCLRTNETPAAAQRESAAAAAAAAAPPRARIAFMERFYVNIAAELDPCPKVVEPFPLPKDMKSGPFSELKSDDVLVGRGKFASNRQGNRYYRALLEANCQAYSFCTKQQEKTVFTRGIVEEIQRFGRFVQSIPGDKHIEISDAAARVKVGQVSLEDDSQ